MKSACAKCLAVTALLAASCHEPGADPVIDDRTGSAEVWTVEAEPAVTIGTVDGPPETLLYRATSALVLPDGKIVVANEGTFELRYYDADGRLNRSVGAEGDGPGEFRSLAGVWRLRGDTIAAWDSRLHRLSFFTHAGDFLGAKSYVIAPMRTSGGMDAHVFRVQGVFADGSPVALSNNAVGTRQMAALGQVDVSDGYRHSQEQVIMLARAGSAPPSGTTAQPSSFADADTIGSFSGDEQFVHRAPNRPGGAVQQQFDAVIYGERFLWAIGPEFFAVGTGKPYVVNLYDRTGALRGTVGRTVPSRPVTDDLVRAYTEAVLENTMPENRATRAQSLENVPAADSLPAYDGLYFDQAGNLWVREFDTTANTLHTYSIFTPDGTWLAQLEVPARLTVIDRGPDYLLTRTRGQFDVEQIRLYRIDRQAR